MEIILSSISSSNIPLVFIIVGIIFIFFALGVQITNKIETSNVKPKQAGIFGTLFLLLGLIIYIMPFILPILNKNSSNKEQINLTTSIQEKEDSIFINKYSKYNISKDLIIKATNNDTESQGMLAYILFQNRDYEESYKWDKIAAEKNYNKSQRRLGLYYRDGLGNIKKDYEKAVNWLKKAARNGDNYSTIHLAYIYFYGGFGIERDLKETKHWIEKAKKINPTLIGLDELSKKVEEIDKKELFLVDDRNKLYYNNGEAIFKGYSYLWSKKAIIDFTKKENYTITFKIKPSTASYRDSKGYIWRSKPNIFLSETNTYNSTVKDKKIKYYKVMKEPIFIDLDAKEEKFMLIQIFDSIQPTLAIAERYSNNIYSYNTWNDVKISFENNKKSTNISVWINKDKIMEIKDNSKKNYLKEYFEKKPKLYLAFNSWSPVDFSIKDIVIE